jgi:N-acetylornithine carbamoyltransferase
MTVNHLTSWREVDDASWEALIARSRLHHAEPRWRTTAADRALGMLFFNPSLRTRTSMEIAAAQLGATSTVLTPGAGTWNLEWRDDVVMNGEAAEHVREAVGVLSHYVDTLGVRVFASMTDYQQDAEERVLKAIQAASRVPVVNLESAFYHPCQALADASALRTVNEGPGGGRRFVLAWATHPKALPMAVPHSALLMAAREGYDVVVARPPEHGLDPGVMDAARNLAAARGRSVTETDDLDAACEGAHVVYAKSWGGPLAYHDPAHEAALRTGEHSDWRITEERMRATDGGVFMHCLPVRRGVVVDGAVLDGPQAIHQLQGAYRLFSAKAILEWVWGIAEDNEEKRESGHL